jgi:hypothetical protein
MTTRALEDLVTTALLDQSFQQALLNGHRREAIADFGLSVEERTLVLSIRAATLEDFAAALSRYLLERGGDGMPVPARLPWREWTPRRADYAMAVD